MIMRLENIASLFCPIFIVLRVVDQLNHIHFFSRPLVARDMPDTRHLDVNTAYACLKVHANMLSSAQARRQVYVSLPRYVTSLLDQSMLFGNVHFCQST